MRPSSGNIRPEPDLSFKATTRSALVEEIQRQMASDMPEPAKQLMQRQLSAPSGLTIEVFVCAVGELLSGCAPRERRSFTPTPSRWSWSRPRLLPSIATTSSGSVALAYSSPHRSNATLGLRPSNLDSASSTWRRSQACCPRKGSRRGNCTSWRKCASE